MKRKLFLDVHGLTLLALALIVLSLLLFMFYCAESNNLWPNGPWGINEGNHGPWRRILLNFLGIHDSPFYILRKTLNLIFQLQFFSVFLAAGNLVIKRKFGWILVFVFEAAFLYVLLAQYYWLID
jgi:hypothetical protein